MKMAFANLLTEYATSSSSATGCRVTLNWSTKDVAAMKYEIERKAPGETSFTKVGELNLAHRGADGGHDQDHQARRGRASRGTR